MVMRAVARAVVAIAIARIWIRKKAIGKAKGGKEREIEGRKI